MNKVEETEYIKWVKRELEFMLDGDEMNKAMYDHLLHMCKEFEKEGHSGFSANYAANCLDKLFRWLPLRPLTGEDDEWQEIGNGEWQNKRCSRVFKGKDGRAYDIDGRIFREPDGTCYTSKDSWVYIDFPYYPKSKYVDVEASDE